MLLFNYTEKSHLDNTNKLQVKKEGKISAELPPCACEINLTLLQNNLEWYLANCHFNDKVYNDPGSCTRVGVYSYRF